MDVGERLCRLRRSLCTSTKLDDDLKGLIIDLVSKEKGDLILTTIDGFSSKNALAKQEVLIKCLAFCVGLHGGALRQKVFGLVPRICRTPTDLFLYLKFEAEFAVNEKGSFGRSKRKLVANWYNNEVKTAKQLAVLMTKYKKRSGWTHADVLKLAHVKPADEVRGLLFKYALKGYNEMMKGFNLEAVENISRRTEAESVIKFLKATEDVRHSHDEQEVARLVREYDLLHEHVPTWMKNSKLVWRALVEKMPILATIKNLGKLASVGLLDESKPENCVQLVRQRLENAEHLTQAKVHPFTILIAWKIYESGHGERGSHKWKSNESVSASLSNAFNLSFGAILPTSKRFLLVVDGCESMDIGGVMDFPSVTPMFASAAMAVALKNKEPSSEIVVLSSTVLPLNIPPSPSLNEVHTILKRKCRGSDAADCSRPITWARENRQTFDVFVIYTCNNGEGGSKTPIQALKEYRKEMNLPYARLVIVTLTSSEVCPAMKEFDVGTIHLAGFGATVHEIIQSFVRGELDGTPGG